MTDYVLCRDCEIKNKHGANLDAMYKYGEYCRNCFPSKMVKLDKLDEFFETLNIGGKNGKRKQRKK